MAESFIISILAVLAVYFGIYNFISSRRASKAERENSDLKLKGLLDAKSNEVMSSDIDDLIDSNNRKYRPSSTDKKG